MIRFRDLEHGPYILHKKMETIMDSVNHLHVTYFTLIAKRKDLDKATAKSLEGIKENKLHSSKRRQERRKNKQKQRTYMMDKRSKIRLAVIIIHINVLHLSGKRKRLLDQRT